MARGTATHPIMLPTAELPSFRWEQCQGQDSRPEETNGAQTYTQIFAGVLIFILVFLFLFFSLLLLRPYPVPCLPGNLNVLKMQDDCYKAQLSTLVLL